MSTRELTTMALLLAILCVSAYITIPLPFSPAPFTATIFVLNLIALLLSPRNTFIVILSYIIIGAVGVPIFAGGTGGLAHLAGPTGGYFIGYIAAFTVYSLLKGSQRNAWRYIVIGCFIALPILYFCGMVGLMLQLHIGWEKAFYIGVLPFIVFDIVKAIVASVLASRVRF